MPNVNEKTGIPYGYISANALEQELVDTLLYETGIDLSYRQHVLDFAKALGFEGDTYEDAETWLVEREDSVFDEDMENYQDDEPVVAGTHEGVTYQSSWLGGALNFWIFESPSVTHTARECSPCVPGAGNLDQIGEGEYTCYSVPTEWLRQE